jgi:hypothetical protein
MTDLKRGVSPEHLRVARIEVSNDPDLQALFRQAREDNRPEAWLADNLAVRLSARWGGKDFDIAAEVAALLARETYDFPDKPLAIVDDQGLVVQRFGEEDVYQPAAVARESGSMVQPFPRLRPEIEAELVTRHHDRAREQAGLVTMAERAGQTALQREDGDRRFDLFTYAGRERILEEFPAMLRQRLFGRRGERASERFEGLSSLEVLARVMDRPPEGKVAQVFDQPIRHTVLLRDLQAVNLRSSIHDRLVEAVMGEWARTIGTLYMSFMNSRAVVSGGLEEHARWPCRAWVAPAEIAVTLRRLAPERRVIAVPFWGPLVQVMAQSTTVVPDFERLEVSRVEYNDRWAISVRAPLRVWWEEHNHLAAFIVDRPDPEGYAEVVR